MSRAQASTDHYAGEGACVRVPFLNQDLGDEAVVNRLVVDSRLVRLDLGQHVASAEAVALLELPRREVSGSHRR